MEELIKQGKKNATVKKGKPSKRADIDIPQIDRRFEYIKKNYNVHALSLRCNSNKCKKRPSKQILISEVIVRSKKSRDLAMVYVCDEHSKNMKKLETDLNQLTKGGMVSVVVSDKK